MADSERLNGVIAALAAGQPTFTAFSTPDVPSAIAYSTSTGYDGIVFEMEHNPWDSLSLRDCLQYMLNRGQIAKSGSLAPAVRQLYEQQARLYAWLLTRQSDEPIAAELVLIEIGSAVVEREEVELELASLERAVKERVNRLLHDYEERHAALAECQQERLALEPTARGVPPLGVLG